MNDILIDYFEWMCSLVEEGKPKHHSYDRLLRELFDQEFTYILPRDGNRYEDGIDLRYRFGYECDIPSAMVAADLDKRPCSVLEMMIALAHRCEEQIMHDPDVGDRTGSWFWDMIESLGLMDQYDSNYDQVKVDYILDKFMEREFERDGKGGLFTIHDEKIDMREEEIWYQLMWYLNERIHYEW